MTRWMALFLFSCSAPDLSLRSEEGCHQWNETAPNECSETQQYGIVECALPTLEPKNPGATCFSPSGSTWSSKWCCVKSPHGG